MSLNVGDSNSRYVRVSNVSMKFAYSDKVAFADLITSHKTGRPKTDPETGVVITNTQGEEVPERRYSRWEGRFVGNAFEPSKTLKNGTLIDITQGWIEKETKLGRDNKTPFTNYYVTISEFTISDVTDAETPDVDAEDFDGV